MKKSELKKEIRNSILENKSKDIDEMSTSGGAGAYNTPYAFKLKKKDKDLDEINNLQEIDEDRYVIAAFEDLEQVVRNLSHTINVSEDEAIEMVIKKLEAMLDGRDDMEEAKENLSENLNPEVTKKVNQFIKAMAKRYGYSEDDAIFAIQTALKQRGSNINEVSDIKMGHLATNDDGVKKPIYLNYGYKLVDKSKS